MSDNKETKQAPAADARARDDARRMRTLCRLLDAMDDLGNGFPGEVHAAFQEGAKVVRATLDRFAMPEDDEARAALASASEPTHTDDIAVDSFARAMKAKMAQARAKGRSGWEGVDPADLSRMLREHIEKGDPRDVANLCMMLWHHSARIARASEAAGGEPVAWMVLAANTRKPCEVTLYKSETEALRQDCVVPLYAAPQPASGQKANHVLVPRELLQDFIDDVEEYAASREFKAREVVWRGERIVSARALLAAKGDGHAD